MPVLWVAISVAANVSAGELCGLLLTYLFPQMIDWCFGLQCIQIGQSNLTLPPSSALLEVLLPQGRRSQPKPHFVHPYV